MDHRLDMLGRPRDLVAELPPHLVHVRQQRQLSDDALAVRDVEHEASIDADARGFDQRFEGCVRIELLRELRSRT
jgi:hypothetical protein